MWNKIKNFFKKKEYKQIILEGEIQPKKKKRGRPKKCKNEKA